MPFTLTLTIELLPIDSREFLMEGSAYGHPLLEILFAFGLLCY